ncbi:MULTISPECIES: hypothetical protein [unclassified Streptomyces]|uniref:hypothetical protein n=1 Tax=unclassified Streptomyces TaxID=2593676 RepID=UPI0021C57090|nr:hypothetical protein [Streptomyces sp. FIT100]UUN29018.1 hypothetical protein KK483_23520 [Streptomyces sp. FIT100]
MAEIAEAGHTRRYVTCVKELCFMRMSAVAKYRRRIAELSGFAKARCASDAD